MIQDEIPREREGLVHVSGEERHNMYALRTIFNIRNLIFTEATSTVPVYTLSVKAFYCNGS